MGSEVAPHTDHLVVRDSGFAFNIRYWVAEWRCLLHFLL